MSSENKGQASASEFEVDSHDLMYLEYQRKISLIDAARVGLTSLVLLSALAVLGTSGDTLAVYNTTHLSTEFNLPLWPEQFDLRPTIALVVGSAIIVSANVVSLLISKVKMLRNQTLVHTSLIFAAPLIGFVAAVIAMTFFYAVNASISVDTLQSWSCRWGYANMLMKPHFGTLCRESQTALYLSIILIPLELSILGIAAYQMTLERKASWLAPSRKSSTSRSSPALS